MQLKGLATGLRSQRYPDFGIGDRLPHTLMRVCLRQVSLPDEPGDRLRSLHQYAGDLISYPQATRKPPIFST